MRTGVRSAVAISAMVLGVLLLWPCTRPASAENADAYLAGDALHSAFAGATLIGTHWAEFYLPGGKIIGRVRYLGLVREYAGRWSMQHDRVCFEYSRPEYNTCSHFRRRGEHLHHFGADGKPKRDGISRHFIGNRLELFD